MITLCSLCYHRSAIIVVTGNSSPSKDNLKVVKYIIIAIIQLKIYFYIRTVKPNLLVMFSIDSFKSKFSYLPLGLRINNIGCLRYNTQNQWNGQKGSFRGYARFEDFDSGVRALTIVLMTYLYKYRLFDVLHMMQRYAPCEDGNSPYLYAHFISSMSGLAKISNNIALIRIQLPMIVYYISCMENGSDYINYSRDENYRQYLLDLVRKYIDEYLNQVVYPSKGKVFEL